ncbi:MAG TPA: branched-chain amino acid ABC transporter permease [Burkholderiales bacterium]|nr:branched-chain amino acid ABC transporter permease [Burkholderiales bacterium]
MRELAAIAAFALAVALLPVFVASGFLLNLAIMVLYTTLLGQAWNLLAGFGGQYSFGHALFFGTGAYASAALQVHLGLNAWLALPVAVALGAAAGLLVGALSFRYGLRGSYFALVTLAFAEVFRILANSVAFTGGGVGLLLPLKESAADMQFAGKAGFLHLILALVLAGFLVSWWLKRSRFGAWLAAVRDGEDSAAALGVDVFRVKLAAIAMSAALMAAGGVFYVQYFHYIDPHIAYGPAVSVEALLGPIVGGLGTVFGPLLGAAVLQLLGEATRNLAGDVPGLSLVVYGLALVGMVMFLPRGLAGLFGRGEPARSA